MAKKKQSSQKKKPRVKPKPVVKITYESHKKWFQYAAVAFVAFLLILLAFWYFLPPLQVEEDTITSVRQQLGTNPLTVEVVYANGTDPSLSSLGILENRIRTYSKDGDNRSISFTLNMFEPNETVYTVEKLKDLEEEHRQFENTANDSALFILYINGRYSTATAVGLAYDDSSFAIFQETIVDYLDSTALPLSLHSYESSILVHEWGHIIGLVNIGYTSSVPGREDADHPFHSTNPRSVMHYAVEFIGITGEPPNDFDLTDQRDILELKASAGLDSNWDILKYRLDRWKWHLFTIIAVVIAILLTSWLWYVRGCRQVCEFD